ncbi:MAG: HD domain-containing protein [Chitinophagaceae bacterium]
MTAIRKIINDPVYGFITIDHPLIWHVISHPFYQRLRNIQQMAFAHLVYPGAIHSRLHHSLGAYHLMCMALNELKSKEVEITIQEELGAKLAILLHDIGHGPFSHALENELIKDVQHETLSMLLLEKLNAELEGKLQTAIDIFTDKYPKKFLHQLVSGQLDADRMDYLNRDSFFTGVAEGVIGYDRIIKMLTVSNGELMVEEKGIYSIEKFLVSRRLMYWQVYLHKTVLCAEKMLQKILQRGIEIKAASPSPFLNIFLEGGPRIKAGAGEWLFEFCQLDDHDIMGAIKHWQMHEDKILSLLCRFLVERKLLKVKLQAEPFNESLISQKRKEACAALSIDEKESEYFVFSGAASNTTYDPADERINILFEDGTIKDISQVDNALIHQDSGVSYGEIKKYYICYLKV